MSIQNSVLEQSRGLSAVASSRIAVIGLMMAVCGVAPVVRANVTNSWSFNNPTDYEFSSTTQVEVADGVAKLKLLKDERIDGAASNYIPQVTDLSRVAIGPNAALRLSKTGGNYGLTGSVESRVFDAEASGNQWLYLVSKTADTPAEIGLPDTPVDRAALAVWHFENTYNEALSGVAASSIGSQLSFSMDAQVGAASLSVPGIVGARAISPVSIPVSSAFTIAFWVKIPKGRNYDGGSLVRYAISLSSPTGRQADINLGGSYAIGMAPRAIGFFIKGDAGVSTSQAGTFSEVGDGDLWRHIVVAYDAGQSPTVRIFKDGVPLPLFVSKSSGAVSGINRVYFGTRSDENSVFIGQLDEVAIFGRALTDQEIAELYGRMRTVAFQLRASSSQSDLQARPFVGPDGTGDTYYQPGYAETVQSAAFNRVGRFAQYKAYLYGQSDRKRTPYLDSVGLRGSRVSIYDDVLSDFRRASDTSGVELAYYVPDPQTSVRISKRPNGGYPSRGTFTSRVFDNGGAGNWYQLQWPVTKDLTGEEGVVSLYHAEGGWGDAGPFGKSATNVTGVAFSSYAKVGAQAAVFSGSGAARIGFVSTNSIYALECWIAADSIDTPVVELCSLPFPVGIAVTNGMVTIEGTLSGDVRIYVNGRGESRRLLPGWNHVAVVCAAPLPISNLVVGRTQSGWFSGKVDELALFSAPLNEQQIYGHYLRMSPDTAGRPGFQVRGGNTLPLTSPFVGPGGSAADTIRDYTGGGGLGNIPGTESNKRYLQYRIVLAGDGEFTPSVESVTVRTLEGLVFTDTTAADFGAGEAGAGGTVVLGDQIGLEQLGSEPGLINMLPEADMAGLWHMDEAAWSASELVLDSSLNSGRSGFPFNGIVASTSARVGTHCAAFDGVNDYIEVPGFSLPAQFTVMGWFRTRQSSRTALFSRTDGTFALELNSDGTQNVPGVAALVLMNGTRRVVTARTGGINDGSWHHIAGVCNGTHVHIFVDGVMVGSKSAGSNFGGLSGVSGWIGRLSGVSSGGYLSGSADEIAVFSRALSEKEIGRYLAAGANTQAKGTYESSVFDAGQPAIWERISWRENGPLGDPLVAESDGAVEALWHMDAIASGKVADATGHSLDATVGAGATLDAAGRFGACINLQGAGALQVPHSTSLEADAFTVEAWIHPEQVSTVTLFEKSAGGDGYQLALDGDSRPYLRVGASTCKAIGGVAGGGWTHLGASYDGGMLRLYVNGFVVGETAGSNLLIASGSPLWIGQKSDGSESFRGRIDEAAYHNVALTPAQLFDHARSGFAAMRFQGRAADDLPALASKPFCGPDGATNSYFGTSIGESMLGGIPLGRYFQYRLEMATENGQLDPVFYGATISRASYATINPWVAVRPAAGSAFVGELLAYSHVMQTNTSSTVRYQITGDSGAVPRWFYWDQAGKAWTEATSSGGDEFAFQASLVDDVTANIGTFYKQIYDKNGGNFRFKAFLHSKGNDQVALDQVNVVKSEGRITVLVPNGGEVGQRAWLVDTPYTIRWSSSGKVSSNLRIEYSRDNGQTWTVIASGQANDGSYEGWRTPPAPGSQMLVRIRDMSDATVQDASDAPFELVDVFQVTVPNGGETWYLTETNRVQWIAPGSAAARGGQVDIRYAADGSTFDYTIAKFVANAEGSTNNSYAWAVTPGQTPMPLPTVGGRIRVHSADNLDAQFNGQDDSDGTFTLGGIAIVNPAQGAYVNNGKQINLTWWSALAGSHVALDFSRNNGVTWTNVLPSLANQDGQNIYPWNVNLAPSDTARLRMRSLSNPKVRGVSGTFQLADIRITAPAAQASWELRQSKVIRWESGGAGDRVNLYYSANAGAQWTLIQSNVVNAVSNAFTWTVAPYPSGTARIRVVSQLDPENLRDETADFNIAGVRIAYPNGGEIWPLGGTDAIRWEHRDAGSEGALYVSLNGGTTWTYLGARGMGNQSINWRPDFPTARGLARIDAVSPPVGAVDMKDQSDAFFTVGGIVVTAPTNSQLITIGDLASVSWTSAGAAASGGDGFARLYYLTGGQSNLIATVANNENPPGANGYQWNVPAALTPSTSAKVVVRSGPFKGESPAFTLRGIRFKQPTDGSVLDIGSRTTVTWDRAGLDSSAQGFIFLSADNGQTYEASAINISPIKVVDGMFQWDVPTNAIPSTEAVLKFVVQTSLSPKDVNYSVTSRPFILRGMKIVSPKLGDGWAHGSSNQVHLVASRAGSFVSIYYSPDGATYDLANPVVRNLPLQDGHSHIPWRVEAFRLPSTTARLKAVSSVATTLSEPFTLKGVRVLRPYATDIWAVGETNTITWVGVGTANAYDVFVERPGGPSVQVAAAYAGTSLTWAPNASVVGTGVTVRVRDAGGYVGTSDVFRIVSNPTVIISSPEPGDFWQVTDTYAITWSRGGGMTNDFSVYSSTAPYSSSKLLYKGPAAYDAVNNAFSYPWTIPDELGPTKITVVNNGNASILDESAEFYIVGKFQLVSPNGGEQTLFARKPATVVWYTWGSVQEVNLYYSIDPLHADGTWVKINTTPVANPGHGTEPSTYQWEVADLGGAIGNVRVRVEQADRPGAYDDSDADFSINYYTIVWDVVDEKTGQHLSNLSVTESSGVSASGLTAPVTRKYPYGRFDTVWSREYFYDNVLFNWLSEPSRTIQVTMKRSDVDPDYSVRANFTYEGGVNDRLAIYAWIERGGAVQPDPTKCTVYVYDVDGNSVTNLISTTPQPTTGVFRYSWDQVTKTLTRGQTYYAKVEILYSGQPYSSVITYTLRLADTEGLHTAVVSISSNLTDLATAQAQFRSATTAALGTLLTNTASIATDVSALTTSLEERVIAPLNVLTSAVVGVIAPAVTSTLAQVTALEAQVDERTARILTRDGVVALGSVNTILYKTRAGYGTGVLLSVTRPDGTAVLGGQSMREVVGGIYELEVTASWGLGSYIVTCTDPSGKARDSTPLRVVAKDLYNVPIMMTGMSNDLRRVESEILNMSATLSSVSNATVKLDEIIVKLAALTNLDTLASAIQGLDLSALTNVTAMTGKIDDILTGVQGVQTTMGALTNLDDIAAAVGKIDVSALTNLTALSGDVGSILTTVGRLQSSSSDVSNRLTQLDQAFRGVQWSALTNIQTRVGDIQTALGALTNLTDIADAIQSIDLSALTNIGAVATDIQALRTEVGGIRTDLGILTNIETRIGGVETALGALTNLDQIAAAIQGIDVSALTNVASLAGDLARVESGVSSLSNAMAKVDWNSLTNMPGIAGDVASLKTQLAGVDLASLTNIAGQVSALTNAIGGMNWNDVLGLVDTLSAVTGGVASIESYLTQLADVTTLARVGSTLSNAVGQVQSTVNSIDEQLAEVNTSSSQAASSSSQAASKSRSAKTEAGNASSGVQQLLSEIAKGNYSQVAETVASIQQALMEAKKNIDEIPKVVGPENYHEKMMSMASTIQELASSAGYVNLLNLPASELPAEGVEGADKESIGTLSRNLEEMKLSMQVMQKLMDEKLYEPVVESTLIGVE